MSEESQLGSGFRELERVTLGGAASTGRERTRRRMDSLSTGFSTTCTGVAVGREFCVFGVGAVERVREGDEDADFGGRPREVERRFEGERFGGERCGLFLGERGRRPGDLEAPLRERDRDLERAIARLGGDGRLEESPAKEIRVRDKQSRHDRGGFTAMQMRQDKRDSID